MRSARDLPRGLVPVQLSATEQAKADFEADFPDEEVDLPELNFAKKVLRGHRLFRQRDRTKRLRQRELRTRPGKPERRIFESAPTEFTAKQRLQLTLFDTGFTPPPRDAAGRWCKAA